MAINDSGQVVGGPNSSINTSGQYVSGGYSGIYYPGYLGTNNQIVSGGNITPLNYFIPLAINNAGEVAGAAFIANDSNIHPGIYQNGQVTDLFSLVANGNQYGNAVAINQQGDVLITAGVYNGQSESYLYHAGNGTVTELTFSQNNSSMIAAALNNSDQAVGNGFLYSNGSVVSLQSLLPPLNGWTNLNATGINGAGQIVGQGMINGQEEAFLMTPDSGQVPEPSTLLAWLLATTGLALRLSRSGRCGVRATQNTKNLRWLALRQRPCKSGFGEE
jgi:hypothetical protein